MTPQSPGTESVGSETASDGDDEGLLAAAPQEVRVVDASPHRRSARRTIDASDNPAVLNAMRTRNNGRYNGNGREWGTPPELFAKLDAEFDFELDPCASSWNYVCPAYYTEEDNGLERDWAPRRVFMNPPYGREIYAWTRKAREEAAKGAFVVGLLPASTDLAWWHDDIVGHAEVRYIRGRVRFETGGPYRASGFFASVVVIWRPPRDCEGRHGQLSHMGQYPMSHRVAWLAFGFSLGFLFAQCAARGGWL